jgi:hypothetical protein
MSEVVLSHPGQPKHPAVPSAKVLVTGFLAVWLAFVFWFGAGEVFVTPDGALPLTLLVAAAVPILAFLAAFWALPPFREFVLAADLRLLAGVQAWRFAGFGFLAMHAGGLLPGYFAWPAGLGDVAISLAAPWMVVALARRPGFAAGRTFAAWNVLGILDLVAAVGMGTLGSRLFADVAGAVTTTPMARLPLVLIPAYFVPVFIMSHLAALFQARRAHLSAAAAAPPEALRRAA